MPVDSTIVWLNGRLVPAADALVPATDRGLLYGDLIFESVPVRRGRPFRWEQHLDRLDRGSALTGIRPGLDRAAWHHALQSVLAANGAETGVVRVTATRGSGPRGYSPRNAGPPTVLITWHPSTGNASPHPGWRLRTSRFQVAASDPLAQAKHGSRLLNVLARAEAEAAGADEALLVDTGGHIVEAASGNVFWLEEGRLLQPAPDSGALPGITAGVVVELAGKLGLPTGTGRITPAELKTRDGAFLTLSSLGIVPVLELDGTLLSADARIADLARALHDLMDAAGND